MEHGTGMARKADSETGAKVNSKTKTTTERVKLAK